MTDSLTADCPLWIVGRPVRPLFGITVFATLPVTLCCSLTWEQGDRQRIADELVDTLTPERFVAIVAHGARLSRGRNVMMLA
jgi:hypothetical protein